MFNKEKKIDFKTKMGESLETGIANYFCFWTAKKEKNWSS